ncbi:probable starch synthase 4, chloroplastic/amyloplastic [Oryza brachyantha]|uniref:probable starch synthase 4, chloroplastic/amyloplastic n=1 Tax=Oryza brachyantha TaxID=4533 RepID=UPI0003EAA133|nr:probable starch synthase 4, chloroplastic/amyloplastic [Oryza brachyantha]XP_015689286.1 probable starch synthase 4, chloroplastic/amyloplastic [Oryza brachyantha]XP_015689287.1 probable starch synthase 4, chloroplastic/amyloplastic [Oryza brachyantha]
MEAPAIVVGAALGIRPPPRPLRRSSRVVVDRLASCCSREGRGDGRSKPHREGSNSVRLSVKANNDQETYLTDEQRKEIDIWELFSEAQRNILYLNKQRLVAMEELKKLQDENESLLQDIEVLETEMKGISTETAESSIFCELLLRIDTMAVSGMVGMAEASDLRKKVFDNRYMISSIFCDTHHMQDTELLSELRLFLRKPVEKPLHVVHICSEMDPIASCGSLATYVTGLSSALKRKGNLVEVILPKYAGINEDGIHCLRKAEADYESYFGGHWHKNRIWTGISSGVSLTLIEPVKLSYFDRDMIRGYPDDFERFSYFARASLDYIVKSGKQPDVLHVHNWETSIVGPLFWDLFAHQGLGNTRIVLTCQDLNSQCLEDPNKLELCGLDPQILHRPDRLQDNSKTSLVNVLKGGIVYSNKVLLMSSTHPRAVVIQGLGHGLEATLTTHKDKVLVASQWLDGEHWDPSKDIYLPHRYSANHIEGKSFCRKALKRRLGFHIDSSIVVGCVYDGYSNIDDLREAVHVALDGGAQVVLMECKGPAMSSTVQALKELKGDRVMFIETYDEALEHLIFAGSDIFMCSSFHDPSLQIAIRAIKYGSAPVQINFPSNGSRQTEWHDNPSTALSQYIISTYGGMSLPQALDDINKTPSQWDWRIKNGMSKVLSWDAECYDLHWEAYSAVRKL